MIHNPPDEVPCVPHMRGQRRGNMQCRPRRRMLNRQTARMQMHFASDLFAHAGTPAIAEVFLGRAAILTIADNRMPDLGHMRA